MHNQLDINNIRNRHIMFTQKITDMDFDHWCNLTEYTITGMIDDKFDLAIFPDGINSVTIERGCVKAITCNVELDSLETLTVNHTGCESINLINLMGMTSLRVVGVKPEVLGTVSTVGITITYNGDVIHRPEPSILEIIKDWTMGWMGS